MRLNQHTALLGSRVTLLPYMRAHVPQYHAWMCDAELLRLTASEPLSLAEEFENQQSWLLDPLKLTFIVASADAERRLLGDVNLYTHAHFEPGEAEVAVMIAEPSARRSGCAREALLLVMAFAVQHLAISTFIAKIDHDNRPSRLLFQKLGFTADAPDPDDATLLGAPNVFGEVELRLAAAALPPTPLVTEFVERDDVDHEHAADGHSSTRTGSSTPPLATSASLHATDTAAN